MQRFVGRQFSYGKTRFNKNYVSNSYQPESSSSEEDQEISIESQDRDFDEPPNKSQFFITANTNQSYKNNHDSIRAEFALKRLIENYKTDAKLWVKVLKVPKRGKARKWEDGETSQKTQEPEENADVKQEIKKGEFSIKIKGAEVEEGKKKSRMHFHIFVQIKHNSRFHIDVEKFKNVSNDILRKIEPDFDVRISYVNVAWIPHHDSILWNYINKDKKQLKALKNYE